jgi:hypothetical protein
MGPSANAMLIRVEHLVRCFFYFHFAASFGEVFLLFFRALPFYISFTRVRGW